VHSIKKRLADVSEQAVRVLARAAARDVSKRHCKVQFREHEFYAQPVSSNRPPKPVTCTRRRIGRAQNLTRIEDRTGYDSVCFRKIDFQALVEPCSKSIRLRPSCQLPKFLQDTRPGTVLGRASHDRSTASVFCREREPALHICPDSLTRALHPRELTDTQATSWRQYFVRNIR